MTVRLTLTDDQAKAIQWAMGKISGGVSDDLDITRVYNKLHDIHGVVTVTGVETSAFDTIIRIEGESAKIKPSNRITDFNFTNER